jgi:hypothetical protein
VLKELMRVHDVPRRVRRFQAVDVTDLEVDVRVIATSDGDGIDGGIDTADVTGTDPPCEVGRNRARPAPHIE